MKFACFLPLNCIKYVWIRKFAELNKRCLFDDDFMSLVFDRNIEATGFLLNTIFDREGMSMGGV
jgi:hypothetical protein